MVEQILQLGFDEKANAEKMTLILLVRNPSPALSEARRSKDTKERLQSKDTKERLPSKLCIGDILTYIPHQI